MSKRKILLVFVAVILLVGMTPVGVLAVDQTDAKRGFSDMPNDWSTVALQHAVDNGLLVGANGKLNPKGNLTRAEMATIITRAFNAQVAKDVAAFSDVKVGEWYADYLAKAYQMQVIQGGNGLMKPMDQITRQEAFVIIARAMKLTDASEFSGSFSDVGSLAVWAKGGVAALANAGYIQGAGGKLNPTANITRAEFAQVMKNVIAHYINKAGTYTENYTGNVMVNVANVTLRNSKVTGDVILGDGVGDGDVTLDGVNISGKLILRGGGANSIVIKGNSNIGTIIIARIDGEIRVIAEDGVKIDVVIIDDGSDDVVLEGEFGTVTVLADNIVIDTTKAKIEKQIIEGTGSIVIKEDKPASEDTGGTPPAPTTVAVTGVTLDKTTDELTIGDEIVLTATVLPANATNKNVNWSSADTGVATVDNSGKVTAVSAGTAVITASTVDGNKTATCTVTVEAPAVEEAAKKIELTVSSTLDDESITEVVASVDENYVARAFIPANAIVNAGNATLTLTMTDVDSLGIVGTRSHSLVVNTGITGVTVDLLGFIDGLISLDSAVVKGTFGANEVTYSLVLENTSEGYEWTMTPNTTAAARSAWQYVAGLVEVNTYSEDDSKIYVPEGAYLIVGNDKLDFTSVLNLENVTGDLDATEQAIRDAVVLNKDSVTTSSAQVEIYVPNGAKLRVGQSGIELNAGTGNSGILIKINGLTVEEGWLDSVLEEMQAATGVYGMIKGGLDLLNLFATGLQGSTESNPVTVDIQKVEVK